jgi:serine phosphatase RsbU (regulator of sigma subunit)
MDLQTFFQEIPILAHLPIEDQLFVAQHHIILDVPPQTIIFREGEDAEFLYIVIHGHIQIIKGLNTQDEYVVAERGAGELFGEMAFWNDGLRTASVRTTGQTRLLKIPKPYFIELLQRQPGLVFEIAKVLTSRLDEAHNLTIDELRQNNLRLRQLNLELQQAQTEVIEKKKLDHELFLAYEIQMSILPNSLPTLAGFDFGARLTPARTVGGDLFDFIKLDENRVGVLVGDVSDKGVPAAIFMAQARALFRAEASRNLSPAEVLYRANRHLLEMNARGLFVSAIYGIVDNQTREFTYVRAGHDIPLVMQKDGQVSLTTSGRGQILGVFDAPVLQEQTISLTPGMMVLLYTDGATDVHDSQGKIFGQEKLQSAFAGCHQSTAQQTCDALFRTLSNYRQNTAQFDDITLVAIHAQA